MSAPLVLVIGGPTASGKSSLAMDLALEHGRAEIVCADSVTVYRGLEIGAAKPTARDRARVPHHLLDIASPADNFTAGDFVAHARAAVDSILARGALPIVVGGTGFYLRALLRGMAQEEDGVRAAIVKAELEARGEREGFAALHAELLRRDPGSAPVIHPNDHYRIVRALQAMELSGKTWSELNRVARAQPPHYPGVRFFWVDPGKDVLEQRILARAQAMVTEGIVEEVRGLLAGGVPPDARPLQSVGYAETLQCLEGKLAPEALVEAIAASTRRLAKSQRTWFRGEELARGPVTGDAIRTALLGP